MKVESETRRFSMVRFYDPKDRDDLARVETILKRAGIEYFLNGDVVGPGSAEIQVAEEDLSQAEELLQREGKPV